MKKKLITQNDDLIAQGLAKKLIRVSEGGKRVELPGLIITKEHGWLRPAVP